MKSSTGIKNNRPVTFTFLKNEIIIYLNIYLISTVKII